MTTGTPIPSYYRYRTRVSAVRLDEDGMSGPEEVTQQVLSIEVPSAGQRVSGAFFGDLPGSYLVVRVTDFEVLPKAASSTRPANHGN